MEKLSGHARLLYVCYPSNQVSNNSHNLEVHSEKTIGATQDLYLSIAKAQGKYVQSLVILVVLCTVMCTLLVTASEQWFL